MLFLFNFWELLKEKARNAQKGLSIKRISIALIILGVVYLIRTVWTQKSVLNELDVRLDQYSQERCICFKSRIYIA